MKKILIFQWFDCSNDLRKIELTECIKYNLNLGFDQVIIFNDSVDPAFYGDNIINIIKNQRISYKDYINIVADPLNYGSLVILSNTDIKLDKNILLLDKFIDTNNLFVFSRYENDNFLATAPWCTQDTWAIISQPIKNSIVYQCDLPLGTPGCELRFAEIFFSSGFFVYNPCLDIKNIHLHSQQKIHLDSNRIYGAYLFTPPSFLKDVIFKNNTLQPSIHYLTSDNNELLTIR